MKKVTLPILAITVLGFSNISCASGDHAGEHKSTTSMQKMSNSSHMDMDMTEGNEHGHGDASGHHDEKTPVGYPGSEKEVSSVVNVTLSDAMRIEFSKPLSEIKAGTVIKFVVKNEGRIPHEFSIANEEGQKEHLAMMRSMPNMVHNDGNTVTVAPGKSSTLIWKFDGKELVVFSCNIPGHFEAGMFKKVAIKS